MGGDEAEGVQVGLITAVIAVGPVDEGSPFIVRVTGAVRRLVMVPVVMVSGLIRVVSVVVRVVSRVRARARGMFVLDAGARVFAVRVVMVMHAQPRVQD